MTEKQIKEQQIRNLQCDLSSTDYKVIKCFEAQMLGQAMPYDIEEVHSERQQIRDQINQLQEEVDALDD